jgi:hypothetical protein
MNARLQYAHRFHLMLRDQRYNGSSLQLFLAVAIYQGWVI